MAGKSRIYCVTENEGDTKTLIRSTSKAGAVRRFVHDRISVEVASQDTIISAMQAGAAVIESTDDE